MRHSTPDLQQYLDQLAAEARPGDRLPTIRDLMRRFGASQMVVQRAVQSLKARGLIDAQVGRGTYFRGTAAAGGRGPASAATSPAGAATSAATSTGTRPVGQGSVLLLRRSISITRGRVLLEGLQRRFTADGHRVLEVSYTDPEHARSMLKGLSHFDACVVQSTFKTLTIGLLAALRDKTEVLAVDGMALVGADVEAVGMEWGEPLAAAVALLRQHGHRRIAYAATSQPFLATQLGRRRFDALQHSLADCELQALSVPHLPDANYDVALASMIRASLDSAGRPPFTALVAWGIEDGAKFRRLLSEIGLDVPSALSVVLLGRTDLASEHAEFFDTIGCSVADQVEGLYQAITARWADPSRPYGVHLIPVAKRAGQSVAAPAAGNLAKAPSSHPRVKPRAPEHGRSSRS